MDKYTKMFMDKMDFEDFDESYSFQTLIDYFDKKSDDLPIYIGSVKFAGLDFIIRVRSETVDDGRIEDGFIELFQISCYYEECFYDTVYEGSIYEVSYMTYEQICEFIFRKIFTFMCEDENYFCLKNKIEYPVELVFHTISLKTSFYDDLYKKYLERGLHLSEYGSFSSLVCDGIKKVIEDHIDEILPCLKE